MNADKLQQKLVEAARTTVVSDQVPHAFEKRIMARLKDAVSVDPWAVWSRSLWRSALACLAVAAVVGVWGFRPVPQPEPADLAAQLESSIYASAAVGIEELW